MHSLVNWDKKRVRAVLTFFGAVIASTVLLVYFLPRENKFGYEYEMGKPWRYAPLIASYDFPIYKTNEQIAAERDSVLRGFRPFYEEDPQLVDRQVQALRSNFYAGRMQGVPASYLPHLVEMLRQVYEAGVMSTADLASLAAAGAPGISVVVGQAATQRPVGELFSTRSAYEYIMHADTLRYNRQLMARCNLNDYPTPNLTLGSAETQAAREDLLSTVSPASGMVQSGQRIIDRGEIVSATQLNILDSLQRENLRRNAPDRSHWQVLGGQLLFIVTVMTLFMNYLRLFRRPYLEQSHATLMLFTLVTLFAVVTMVVAENDAEAVYLVPFAMVPIFVRIFLDSRTAFMTLVSAVLLVSPGLQHPYEFILLQAASGLAAIYSLKELTERSQLLRSAVIVTMAMLFAAVAYDLMQGLSFADFDRTRYIYMLVNGVLLLFAYPLMYLIERVFGFTSSVSLVEMTNINNSILRKMSKEAQGTFNHSMTVANLAAEVALKIGANSQLVRTGALYHDIGKVLNPAFFTENQSGVNPHDGLAEERSAQIIIGHVTDGLRLAEKYHLPKVIRDFIATHHGRGKVKYFYIQWCNKHPGEKPDEELFTYPGPNPTTKEQAILMMCDAVEASSRSLKELNEESLRDLVHRIVDRQVEEGNFRECPITFRDISDAKRVLVESLKTIYHTRIAYPEPGDRPRTPSQPRGFFGAGLHRNRRR